MKRKISQMGFTLSGMPHKEPDPKNPKKKKWVLPKPVPILIIALIVLFVVFFMGKPATKIEENKNAKTQAETPATQPTATQTQPAATK